MASIRAVHEAKHHRELLANANISTQHQQLTTAVQSLLTSYGAIKTEYDQLIASPSLLVNNKIEVGSSPFKTLLERLLTHVEDLANKYASANSTPTTTSRGSHNPRGSPSLNAIAANSLASGLDFLPMPSFIPHDCAQLANVGNCSVAETFVESFASCSLRVQNQLKHGEDCAGFATLNSYVVVNEIGDGTTAKVLQVYDMLTSQMFAIKRLKRTATSKTPRRQRSDANTVQELQNSMSTTTALPPSLLRSADAVAPVDENECWDFNFRKEIAIMKKLKHPNLVKLHEVIDDKSADHVYLVMDFVQGGPLLEIDDKANTVKHPEEHFFSPRVVRAQFRCIANAIHYLHRHGIAHLDIKPENILLDEHGDPIIIDFGVAHLQQRGKSDSPTKFGTPYFFSPEQCEGVPANEMDLFAADIWALGVTLYTMLFHKLPFHAACYPDLRDAIQGDTLEFPPDCPSDARSLLTTMLCKDPKQRLTIKAVCRHPFVKAATARPGDLLGGRRKSTTFSNSVCDGHPLNYDTNAKQKKRLSVRRLSVRKELPPPESHLALPVVSSLPSIPSKKNGKKNTPRPECNTLSSLPNVNWAPDASVLELLEDQPPLPMFRNGSTFFGKKNSFSRVAESSKISCGPVSESVSYASTHSPSRSHHRPRDVDLHFTVSLPSALEGRNALDHGEDDDPCDDVGRDVGRVTSVDVDNAIHTGELFF